VLDYNKLQPTPHWSKPIFKRHSIKIASVACVLDLSFAYVSNMLNGYTRVTPENEAKITELVRFLESKNEQLTESVKKAEKSSLKLRS